MMMAILKNFRAFKLKSIIESKKSEMNRAKLENEKLEKERIHKEKLENERIQKEKLESERIHKEQIENETGSIINRIKFYEEMIQKRRKEMRERDESRTKNMEYDIEEQMQCVDEIISWTETLRSDISKLPSSLKVFHGAFPSKEKIMDKTEEVSNSIMKSKSSKCC